VALLARPDRRERKQSNLAQFRSGAGKSGWSRGRELVPSWVAEIHEVCREALRAVLPKSTLGQAAQSMLNVGSKLKRSLSTLTRRKPDVLLQTTSFRKSASYKTSYTLKSTGYHSRFYSCGTVDASALLPLRIKR
jgi:hypothetical protein